MPAYSVLPPWEVNNFVYPNFLKDVTWALSRRCKIKASNNHKITSNWLVLSQNELLLICVVKNHNKSSSFYTKPQFLLQSLILKKMQLHFWIKAFSVWFSYTRICKNFFKFITLTQKITKQGIIFSIPDFRRCLIKFLPTNENYEISCVN